MWEHPANREGGKWIYVNTGGAERTHDIWLTTVGGGGRVTAVTGVKMAQLFSCLIEWRMHPSLYTVLRRHC